MNNIFRYKFNLHKLLQGKFIPIPAIEHIRTLRNKDNVEEDAKELIKLLFILQEFYIEPHAFLKLTPSLYANDYHEYSYTYIIE